MDGRQEEAPRFFKLPHKQECYSLQRTQPSIFPPAGSCRHPSHFAGSPPPERPSCPVGTATVTFSGLRSESVLLVGRGEGLGGEVREWPPSNRDGNWRKASALASVTGTVLPCVLPGFPAQPQRDQLSHSGPRPPSPAVLPTTTQTNYLHAHPHLGVCDEGSEIQALMKVLTYYGQLCSFTWKIDKGVLCPFN